jgi:hypothetical protein
MYKLQLIFKKKENKQYFINVIKLILPQVSARVKQFFKLKRHWL